VDTPHQGDFLLKNNLFVKLLKGKRLEKVEGNFWNRTTTKAEIAEDGLTASNNIRREIYDVAAEK
jgi:hypothetical protein